MNNNELVSCRGIYHISTRVEKLWLWYNYIIQYELHYREGATASGDFYLYYYYDMNSIIVKVLSYLRASGDFYDMIMDPVRVEVFIISLHVQRYIWKTPFGNLSGAIWCQRDPEVTYITQGKTIKHNPPRRQLIRQIAHYNSTRTSLMERTMIGWIFT